MFTELLAKRQSILDVFKKASQDLEEVNTEIASSMDSNLKVITELTQENANLGKLKIQNNESIKSLKKILGEK